MLDDDNALETYDTFSAVFGYFPMDQKVQWYATSSQTRNTLWELLEAQWKQTIKTRQYLSAAETDIRGTFKSLQGKVTFDHPALAKCIAALHHISQTDNKVKPNVKNKYGMFLHVNPSEHVQSQRERWLDYILQLNAENAQSDSIDHPG